MDGKVQYKHALTASVAVLMETGAFSIFKLLLGDAEVGDQISWVGIHPLGVHEVSNLTRGSQLRVLFEHHHVPTEQVGWLLYGI